MAGARGKAEVQVETHQVDPALKALVFRPVESTVLSKTLVSNTDLHPLHRGGGPFLG